MQGAERWAREEFGTVALGDVRRTRRLTAMAATALRRPSGKVSAVFERADEREGAYDFLESEHVQPDAVAAGMFAATAKRATGSKSLYVVIDHTSLTLTDVAESKGFGPIRWKRGIMVLNALAVSRDGVPLGLIEQRFWTRKPVKARTHTETVARNRKRRFSEKEPYGYVRVAKTAAKLLRDAGVEPWIVIDRIADNADVLSALDKLGRFTARGGRERVLFPRGAPSLHTALDRAPSLGEYVVSIGRSGCRAARTATVDVRATVVQLPLRKNQIQVGSLSLYAVRLREARPEGLEWLLYTNKPILTADDARELVASYEARWRVEEFHKTWKSGQCNVEHAQLRSKNAVIKWATVLAAVATRIERLKYLSRTTPDEPASVELGADEIEALKFDRVRRRQQKRRATPEPALADSPSIGEATRWIAELGGWVRQRTSPPGSIVLARGLERLAWLVEGIAIARDRPLDAGRRPT
jgi:Transposase DNA-binding/Transposase DDE domain